MNNSDPNKTHKYKRPKQKSLITTNPESSASTNSRVLNKSLGHVCPLLAKDSEWADLLQSSVTDPEKSITSEEEEVLQLVECEESPQMKPLAIMFPGLLENDPQTFQGMLNKAMSTTEVTRHLVDLGQKANFTFMKKADRLIPREKQWLDSLTENSNSYCSDDSGLFTANISSGYEADDDEINKYEGSRTPDKVTLRANKNSKDILMNANQMVSDIVQEIYENGHLEKKNA